MIDLGAVPLTTRAVSYVEPGIELPYPERRIARTGALVWPAGTAFVTLELLDELCEADNSWGAGGAYVMQNEAAQAALDEAGLIHVETRGGVHTDEEQREAIRALIARYYGTTGGV